MIEGRSLSIRPSHKEKQLISNLDFKVSKGEFIGLIGLNGSGKSTFLRNIYGEVKVNNNQITIDSKTLNDYTLKGLSDKISFFENGNYYFGNHTVTSFIQMGLISEFEFLKIPAPYKIFIDTILCDFGLDTIKNKLLNHLSDGEKQKALLCHVLIRNTDYLLLDEPTSHLDIKNKNHFFSYLKKHSKNKGIVMATHDIDLACKFCSVIWLICKGNILVIKPKELQSNADYLDIIS